MNPDGGVLNKQVDLRIFCACKRKRGLSNSVCPLHEPIKEEPVRSSGFKKIPQTQGDLIGKIPWLQAREISSTPIVESEFGQRFMLSTSLSESSANANIYSMITTFADAFPSYLPNRYHAMDCDAIRRNSENGAYWINALHFSNICINYGTQPYYNLSHGKSVGLERAKMNAKTLQDEGGPELCGTAAEFLFEPWVLLQLPFQPALLHQWAVAAYVEALKYSRRFIEVINKNFASRLHKLYHKLMEIVSIVLDRCRTFIAHFFMIYCKAPEESIHIKAKKMLDQKFSEQLAETLAALEFILSDSSTHILNFIKRSSWNKTFQPKGIINLCKSTDRKKEVASYSSLPIKTIRQYLSLYCPLHWVVSDLKIELRKPDKEFKGLTSNDKENSSQRKKDPLLDQVELQPHVKDFKALACQRILKGGPLKGVEDPAQLMDDIMNSLSPQEECYYAYDLFGEYDNALELGSEKPASSGGGVIQQLLNLRMDITAEMVLGAMTNMVWREATKLNKNIYLDASDVYVPEGLTEKDCLTKINEYLARKNQWTVQKIFANAESTLNGSHADTSSVRIRALVLKMYKKQYSTCKDGGSPFHFYPECHLVQYILPCFVAMFLDAQEDPNLSVRLKKKIEKLVDEFIKSYEQQEYVQLIGKSKIRNFHSPLNGVVQNVLDTLTSKFKKSSNMQINLNRLAIGMQFCNNECFRPKLGIANVESDFPLYMLFQRMENCLEIVGWGTILNKFMTWNYIPIFAQIKNKFSDLDKVFLLRLAKLEIQMSAHVTSSILADAKSLSINQLFGICFFQVMNARMNQKKLNSTFQMPFFPLDPCSEIVSKILSRDWWALREIFSPLLGRPGESLELIRWEVAKNNSCCRPLLSSRGGDTRVPMANSGEITFSPIQHCRWCGLVNARHFQLCAECKDEPEFPLPNYFCSQGCEDKAMDACHLEEHARFVMMKLGIWE